MGDGNNNNNDNDGNSSSSSCCNAEQTAFLCLYLGYVVLAVITWKTLIAKPMRLIAVFLHEMSHAVACWITGGDVRAIEVYENEGGVTRYVGGCRILIVPAGYVGCGFWAMIFVILSGGRNTATFAAIAFTIALLVALCYSPNKTMVYLNLAYAVLTLAFILLEWFVVTPILQFVILLYGVVIGLFSIADIYDDLISRSVNGSDAYACYELCPCCMPRCVGIQWAVLAIFFQVFGAWLAMVEMSNECEEKSWGQCAQNNLRLSEFDLDMNDFWHGPHEWFNWDNGP